MNRLGDAWKLYLHTSEEMPEIKNNSAQLVIASPPFTNRSDGKTLDKNDYLDFIERVFSEVLRILIPTGVLITVNTDLRDHARYNWGCSRFNGLLWPKHCAIRAVAECVGFCCFDAKVWVKSLNRNIYRYNYAYIQFFRKGGKRVRRPRDKKVMEGFGPDVWLLEEGTYRRDSRGFIFRDAIHPEIAERCINQFTSLGDLVVSPFAGSGTILCVANLMGRQSIGYEINRNLKFLIKESITRPKRFPVYRDLLERFAKSS